MLCGGGWARDPPGSGDGEDHDDCLQRQEQRQQQTTKTTTMMATMHGSMPLGYAVMRHVHMQDSIGLIIITRKINFK